MGSDDHVTFGLAVIAHAVHTVDLSQLVDDLAVVSVHGSEAVALLWRFSLIYQLNKILELLFHLVYKFQVLSGVVFEAVAVYGGRADVEGVGRCVDLQRLRQASVSLQGGTFFITFKPRLFHLLLCEQRPDVHGVTQLHIRQFARHGDGCISLIRAGCLRAHHHFLSSPTIALHRNLGSASSARAAVSFVARSSARVAAVRTRQQAGLLAVTVWQTVAAVADPSAAVHFTRQCFVTRQATGDVLQVARDVAALLVVSHAPFLSEVSAWWTLLLTVAVVKHWMVTLVSSCAHVFALWWLRAAGDGWVQDSESAVTRQLIKTGLPAGLTVSTMTRLLAAVETTVELVAADQEALMLRSHTAKLATLVTATGAFLVAAPLTGENKLVLFSDSFTWDFLRL